jgi:hypothetical protein
MTKFYETHQLADLFSMLEDNSIGFKALMEDIKAKRQLEPIWLYGGKILDGRNRWRACSQLGIDATTREFVGDDPVGFVLSSNLHRRHLNESQRAMVGAKLAGLGVGANQHTKGEGTSIEGAAKLLNVGRASIERALQVLKSGDPSLVQAVEQGKQSVSGAANTVRKKRGTGSGSGKSKPKPQDFVSKVKELWVKEPDEDRRELAFRWIMITSAGVHRASEWLAPDYHIVEGPDPELEEEETVEAAE